MQRKSKAHPVEKWKIVQATISHFSQRKSYSSRLLHYNFNGVSNFTFHARHYFASVMLARRLDRFQIAIIEAISIDIFRMISNMERRVTRDANRSIFLASLDPRKCAWCANNRRECLVRVPDINSDVLKAMCSGWDSSARPLSTIRHLRVASTGMAPFLRKFLRNAAKMYADSRVRTPFVGIYHARS